MNLYASYEEILREASILKAEADSIISREPPLSDSQWGRIVAYHKAADLELYALDLLKGTPVEAVASHLLEAIALYGRSEDPESAFHHLSKLKNVAVQLPENKYIQSILKQIAPRITHEHRLYDSQVSKIPLAKEFRESPLENVSLEVFDEIIKRFRGAWNLWWMRHFIALRCNEMRAAMISLARARELNPENEQLVSTAILLYAHCADPSEALALCRRELDSLKNVSPSLNLAFALSVITAHRGKIRRSVLREAIDAVLRAKTLADPEADEVLSIIADSFFQEVSLSMAQKVTALMCLIEDRTKDDDNANFRVLPAWLIGKFQQQNSNAVMRQRR